MAKVWRYGALVLAVSLLTMLIHIVGFPGFGKAERFLNVKLNPSTKVIPENFFSLNLINLDYGAVWPTIPFKSWRNFYADWPLLETQKGKWDFKTLDRDMALAEQHGVEMLFILKETPTWASARPTEPGCCRPNPPNGAIAEAKNIEDWRNYVRTTATRYKGRVRYYELWNEPNVKRFYSGTVEQLVKLNAAAYQVLKEVDPAITVISSGMSPYGDHLKYFEEFLKLGGGKYADVIGYHFYVAPKSPEAMLPKIQEVRSLMIKYGLNNKPLWNTEMGWKIMNNDRNLDDEEWAGKALSNEDASAYVARTHILSWATGVERVYWYAWGHRSMGFTEYDIKTPKPVATAYSEVKKWLVGSQMTACESDEENTWICQLKREGGYSAWIVWNPDGNFSFKIPQAWGVRQLRDLFGKKRSLSKVDRLEISSSPLLLENLTQ